MVLLLRKLYLYFTKDPEKSIIFQGRVSNFYQGVQMLISIETQYTYLLFCRGVGGVRTHYPPLDPHMGNGIITGQYLSQSHFRQRIDLSGLMTGEVFQMLHWYCARLAPSRNTALGSGSFCNSAFFISKIPTTSTQ